MTPAARLSAAIEIVADIEARHRPAPEALKDWGLSHRFAGSGDRAALAGLVYDALRRRASSVHVMGDPSPRAILLGMLRLERKLEADAIAALANGERFAPQPLSAEERARLAAPDLEGAPPWVAGDYPEWLDPYLARVFGDERAAEGAALASRAPLDLRVNDIKGEREDAIALLADLNPVPTRWSPFGLRIALEADAKNPRSMPSLRSSRAWWRCRTRARSSPRCSPVRSRASTWSICAPAPAARRSRWRRRCTIKDSSTQPIPTSAGSRPSMSGWRAPARATCRSARRSPRHRACRSRGPRRPRAHRRALHRHRNWRRNPDAKWRVRPGALAVRLKEQAAVLDRAARLVKPGGRIAYVTCSVLAEENGDQIQAFLAREPGFRLVPPARWRTRWESAPSCSAAPR